MRLFLGIIGALILTAPFAFAQESSPKSNDEITVYNSTCEEISSGESTSSARARATDKAIFNALHKLSVLDDYRERTDLQDFNNKIYLLADHYLNSLNINTTSQTDDELCIEISGFITMDSIAKVFNQVNKVVAPKNHELVLEDELDINLPPKPQININKEIAYNEAEASENSNQKPQSKGAVTTNNMKEVFVERTEFFDGNSTAKFFEYIKSDLQQTSGLRITDKMQNPDYILKTKVLKAKVDSLNSETNRLQVVVAVTLVDTKTSENYTEHQNRFILFAAKDDAQKTASALVRKLIASAIGKLSGVLEKNQNSELGNSVITPR